MAARPNVKRIGKVCRNSQKPAKSAHSGSQETRESASGSKPCINDSEGTGKATWPNILEQAIPKMLDALAVLSPSSQRAGGAAAPPDACAQTLRSLVCLPQLRAANACNRDVICWSWKLLTPQQPSSLGSKGPRLRHFAEQNLLRATVPFLSRANALGKSPRTVEYLPLWIAVEVSRHRHGAGRGHSARNPCGVARRSRPRRDRPRRPASAELPLRTPHAAVSSLRRTRNCVGQPPDRIRADRH